jgi:hypothetical protein
VQPATYELVAYNLSTGTQKFAPIPIAPTGFDPHLEQQRAALALANGYVYVAFGGYIGDCGNYHGFVVGIKADGSSTTLNVFQDQAQTVCPAGASSRAAGIWGPSGPAVDAAGNVYVATGNGVDTTNYDCGETVFKLNSTLGYVDSWAPSVWASLNASDTDIGSLGPAIVGTSSNLVFQSGKNGWGYLLNASNLSGNTNHIGAEAFNGPVCDAAITANDQTVPRDQVYGGVAYADPFIYVPCPEGIKALRMGAGPSFSVAWSSSQGFHPGPPIVSGGVVWAVDTNTNTLYGFDATTGKFRFSAGVGGQTHFSTPAAGQGRVFLADGPADVIRAFGQGAGRYHPLTPSRIYDSRGAGGPLGPNTTRDIPVIGQGGVPATGVSAVIVNTTVTNTTAMSYLTVFPTGFIRPTTSNLNWAGPTTVANLVEVAVGDGGQVTVYNAYGNTDVIVDVAGWVSTPGTATADGLYNPLVPARILDTRNGTGGFTTPVGPGQTIDVQVTGRGLVPASGVEAAVFNVTATNSTMGGYLTLFPTGGSAPLASNVNFVANQTVPNRVAVMLGTGGRVSIYNPSGSVHVILDVNGWFTDTTTGGTGSMFTPVTPLRILDTRNGTGGVSMPLGANQSIAVQVAGTGGVPSMAATAPPKAVVLNVTAVGPTSAGYLTVWPDPVTPRPGTSDLNFVGGQTVPNLVVVQVGSTGKIDIYNAFGSTNVVIDVMGWYS